MNPDALRPDATAATMHITVIFDGWFGLEDSRPKATCPALPRSPRRCRFCTRTEADGACFTTEAHALPEALGNRRLISSEECDECNQHAGSALETQLVQFLGAEIVTSGLRDFKLKFNRRSASPSWMESKGGKVSLSLDAHDDMIDLAPTEAGCKFTLRLQSFRPRAVAKSLGRIALMLAREEDLPKLERERRWVMERDDTDAPMWSNPFFFVARREDSALRMHVQLHRIDEQPEGVCRFVVYFEYGRRMLVCPLPGKELWTRRFTIPAGTEVYACDDGLERERRDEFEWVAVEGRLPRPNHDEIALAAYFRWANAGRPEGTDVADWLAAQRQAYCRMISEHGGSQEAPGREPAEDGGR